LSGDAGVVLSSESHGFIEADLDRAGRRETCGAVKDVIEAREAHRDYGEIDFDGREVIEKAEMEPLTEAAGLFGVEPGSEEFP